MARVKHRVKDLLGQLPLAPEMEWMLRRRGEPVGSFKLEEVKRALPEWVAQAAASPYRDQPGKRVFILAVMRYWVKHATLLSAALAGLGHEVTLGYLPYGSWFKPENRYDLRQQNLYGQEVLKQAGSLFASLPLWEMDPEVELPGELLEAVRDVSVRDVQYTEQVEEIDEGSWLYQHRMERNTLAAKAAYQWLSANRPEVVIVPNGLILEFGVVFEIARYLNIPVVSYEFGEQRDRIWFSLNRPVMHQDTSAMWEGRKEEPFTEEQLELVRELFASRQRAGLWRNFKRQWQDKPVEGEESVRGKLDLDERPVVLLAANVIGDSLTLGRQVFSASMTEWLRKTLDYFTDKDEAQFVLRVHPGERYVDGPSVVDIVRELLPDPPEHFHVIAAADPINTYDLIAIADLGLVYTTTTGMEMAMNGVPVVVAGATHYREKGFTIDPDSWEAYFTFLDRALADFSQIRPSEEQVHQAWHYAYRFFFDYPMPFPWHLRDFWENVERWPVHRMLSEEGRLNFDQTFAYLTGEAVPWADLDG